MATAAEGGAGGVAAAAAATTGGEEEPHVLRDIRTDASLSIFLQPGFDANKFATHIITQDSGIGAERAASSAAASSSSSSGDALSQMQHSSSVEQCVDALQRRLGAIDNSIKQIVGRNYDQLLDRAATTSRLKASLRDVQQGVAQAETAALHVRQLVLEPLLKMQQRSQQLARIQTAGALLRALLRMNALAKKLAQQMAVVDDRASTAGAAAAGNGNTVLLRELTKTSLTLCEMSRLVDVEVDGSGSGGNEVATATSTQALFVQLRHVQHEHLPRLRSGVERVLGLAHRALLDGLRKFNQAQVGAALQVHFNLGRLGAAVERASEQVLQNMHDLTLSVFSAAALAKSLGKATARAAGAKASRAAAGGAAAAVAAAEHPLLTEPVRAVLWKRFTKLCDGVYAYSLQVWTLHRVLAKKRDPLTHTPFLQAARPASAAAVTSPGTTAAAAVAARRESKHGGSAAKVAGAAGAARGGGEWDPTAAFWRQLTQQLRASLDKLARNHPVLEQFVTAEYPAVRQQIQSVLSRLHQSTADVAARSAGLPALPRDQAQRAALLGCFDTHLQAYTSQATQSMRGQLKDMFARGNKQAGGGGGSTGNKHAPVPAVVQVSALTAAMRRELRATRHDFGLCAVVLGAVHRVADQFARGMEHARATEPSSVRIRLAGAAAAAAASAGGSAGRRGGGGGGGSSVEELAGVGAKLTRAQVHNFEVVARAAAFSSNLREILAGLVSGTGGDGDDAEDGGANTGATRAAAGRGTGGGRVGADLAATAAEELAPTFEALDGVAHRVLLPFFVAALKEVEDVLMGMHDENFGGSAPSPAAAATSSSSSSSSMYIGRVKAALAACANVYLRPVPDTPLARGYLRQYAQAVMSLFARHASLLKPLSEAGSLRVAADAAELEMALNPLAEARGFRLDNAELQFLKQLLFVRSGREILDRVVPALRLGVDVRPTTVLHHLFSRAAPQLQYPMVQQVSSALPGEQQQQQQHQQQSGRSYVSNYCRWAFEQSITNMGTASSVRGRGGGTSGTNGGGSGGNRGGKGSKRQQRQQQQLLQQQKQRQQHEQHDRRRGRRPGDGDDGAAEAAAVFDPLVQLASVHSLDFEQRAFEKLQACCDQFAQRVTATALAGGGAEQQHGEEGLQFVNDIVQAGANMLARFQRVVEQRQQQQQQPQQQHQVGY